MAITSPIRRPLYDNPTFQQGLERGFARFQYGNTSCIVEVP